MLCNEPIVSCTTIFHSFVYGLLFLLLEAGLHITFIVLYDDSIVRHILMSTIHIIRCRGSNQA